MYNTYLINYVTSRCYMGVCDVVISSMYSVMYNCTLYIVHYTLYIIHYTLYIMHCIQCTVHKIYTVRCTIDGVYCPWGVYTFRHTEGCGCCRCYMIAYSVRRVYIFIYVHCTLMTLYAVHYMYTLYDTVQYTVYNIR